MPPQILFGDIRDLDLSALLTMLKNAGITRLDTAAMYQNGEAEKKIRLANFPNRGFTIDTKIFFALPGFGTLTPEAIDKSLTQSLMSLGMDRVNVLYCHGPDYATPLWEQAKAFDDQYQRSRFAMLGVSNIMPDMLSRWLDVADREGWVKPSVFQGQYNLLCRTYEESLFPLLRKHGMTFNAYSPLAGGFLLGNYTQEGLQGGSRFAKMTSYTKWYDTPTMHNAVRQLLAISEETGLGMDELSLRWLKYHSALSSEDGIILGASKLEHIRSSTSLLAQGPLNQNIVRRLTELWEGVEEDGARVVDTSLQGWKVASQTRS